MSIYINKDTRVITQGITGKTGQFHTEKCQEYANGKNCFVAGVNPKKAGESIFSIPIYASVKEAASQTGATVSVIYVPPAGAAAAIWEAVEAELDLAICITEGIPVKDMLEVRNRMRAKEAAGGKKTLLLIHPALHVHVHPGLERLPSRFGIIPGRPVCNHFADACEIRNHEPLKIPLVPEDVPQQKAICSCRRSIQFAKRRHHARHPCLLRGKERREVNFTKEPLGHIDGT